MDLTREIIEYDDVFKSEHWSLLFPAETQIDPSTEACISALRFRWRERVFHADYDGARARLLKEVFDALAEAGILEEYGLYVCLSTFPDETKRIVQHKKFWNSHFGKQYAVLHEGAVSREVELERSDRMGYAVVCEMTVEKLYELSARFRFQELNPVLFLWKPPTEAEVPFADEMCLDITAQSELNAGCESELSGLAQIICARDGMLLRLPHVFHIPDVEVEVFLPQPRMKQILASTNSE